MLASRRRAAYALVKATPRRHPLPVACLLKRYAHHDAPHYNEPSGYLFGEKPLPPGQKRKREDWELIWYWGMFGSMAVASVLLYFKPDTSIQTWALQEAKRRMEARGETYEYKPPSSSTSS